MTRNGEEYLGIVPITRDQSILQNEIVKQESDYLLSVNLYEILSLQKDSTDFGDEVLHVIHFDLFDKNMKMVNSGNFRQVLHHIWSGDDMSWFYKDFALDQIFWVKAFESDPEKLVENYSNQVDSYFNDITSNKYVGINAGVGMPLGGIGIEIGQLFKDIGNERDGTHFKDLAKWKGLKIFIVPGSQIKVIQTIHGSSVLLIFGNRFNIEVNRMNSELIDPDDVTRFRIFSDQAIHLRAGLNITDKDLAKILLLGMLLHFLVNPLRYFLDRIKMQELIL